MDADLRGLSDEVFLATVYRRYLGRSVDAEGRAHYGGMLRKWRGRKRVLADIRKSEEARHFAKRTLISSDNRQSLKPEEKSVYAPLFPKELGRGAAIRPRVALLGTCLSEGLLDVAVGLGWTMQHYLMDSGLQNPDFNIPDNEVDIVVVNLTLRTVLGMVSGNGNGDLFYLRAEANHELLLANSIAHLNTVIEHVLRLIPSGFPILFLSFLEPPEQLFGVFGRNRDKSIYHLVRAMNDEMESILSTRQNVFYFEINDIRKYYGDAGAYDGYVGHYSHAGLFPRSQQGEWICRDILDRLEGAWAVLCGKDPVKIIITDLDNTLWRGVLAEEEEVVPWRHTEGWPIGYAEALLECKRRGLLLAISSKNDEAPTCDRFRQVWGQALRLEDFCARQINWRPKSDNIADILQATNILPEQALFIDDNPLEIEEVRRAFPQMRFLTGAPERWRHVLLYAPETQVLPRVRQLISQLIDIANSDFKTLHYNSVSC